MKKLGKRLIAILVAMMMILGLLCGSAYAASKTSGKCGKNVKWSYNKKKKTLTISGKGSMDDFDEDKSEEDEDGAAVEVEHATPWGSIKDIKQVVVKKGVSRIGHYAFEFTSIQTISLPEGLEEIGQGAFAACDNLQSVVFPKSLKLVEEEAFYHCPNITSFRLKNPDTAINGDALNVNRIGNYSEDEDSEYDEDEDDEYEQDKEDGDDTEARELTIIGYPGSTAEEYAKHNSHPFMNIKKTPVVKNTSLSSVKWNKKKKDVTVKWKKNTKGNGYELEYYTEKKRFSNSDNSIVKITKNKTVKTTVKKLKKGTWYFRIRTVKGNWHSDWSAAKSITVK